MIDNLAYYGTLKVGLMAILVEALWVSMGLSELMSVGGVLKQVKQTFSILFTFQRLKASI